MEPSLPVAIYWFVLMALALPFLIVFVALEAIIDGLVQGRGD